MVTGTVETIAPPVIAPTLPERPTPNPQDSTKVDPRDVLSLAAKGGIGRHSLSPERRTAIFQNDWVALGNIMKARAARGITDPEQRKQFLNTADFSTPETALQHLDGEAQHTLAALMENPHAKREDFLNLAESQGAITGRQLGDSLKQLDEKLKNLGQHIQLMEPAMQQKIAGVYESFNTLAGGGVVNPEALTQFVQNLPDLYHLNKQGITGFLARAGIHNADTVLSTLMQKITQYQSDVYGICSDSLNVPPSDEILACFTDLIPSLDSAEEAVMSAEAKEAKVRTMGLLIGGITLLMLIQGFSAMGSTNAQGGGGE